MTNPPSSDHEFCIARLSEYMDGRLSETDARVVQEHLLTCAACQRVASDLGRVVERLHVLRRTPVSGDVAQLWPQVARQLAPRAAVLNDEDSAGRRARRALAAGLLLFIGAAGGWYVGAARCGHLPGFPSGVLTRTHFGR